jgi:hypothetical protein
MPISPMAVSTWSLASSASCDADGPPSIVAIPLSSAAIVPRGGGYWPDSNSTTTTRSPRANRAAAPSLAINATPSWRSILLAFSIVSSVSMRGRHRPFSAIPPWRCKKCAQFKKIARNQRVNRASRDLSGIRDRECKVLRQAILTCQRQFFMVSKSYNDYAQILLFVRDLDSRIFPQPHRGHFAATGGLLHRLE